MVPVTHAAGWRVVVPIKGTSEAKSRLSFLPELGLGEHGRAILAHAFACDTLAAVDAVVPHTHVFIVTDPAAFENYSDFGICVADPGAGLNPAIAAGISAARADDATSAVAVLTGDLAALTPRAVSEALDASARVPLGLVADSTGTGTTMITAAAGMPLTPRFGVGSAQTHRDGGQADLELGHDSVLRLDIDSRADLREAYRRGVGEHTIGAIITLGLESHLQA